MAEIGRLQGFALGIESTSGTEGTLDTYIRLTKGNLMPIVARANEESGLGVIDKVSDTYITQLSSEFAGEGDIRADSFGYLLLLALGTAGTPTLVETGVYSHTFTRANTNTHPSATVFYYNGTQQEKATYNMLETLDITGNIGEKVTFSTAMKGGKVQNATGLTPTYGTTDTPFLTSNVCVKIADTVSGLSSATPIRVNSFSLNITKELTQKFKTKADCSVEALELANQFNQGFSYSGTLELDYDSATYRDYFTSGTKKAVGIYLTGPALIGSTEKAKLSIILPKVEIENFTRSDSMDEVQTQSLGLIGMYDQANATTISATLQNLKTTQYA